MRYSVLVKPGSSQEKIVSTTDNFLTIYTHATPHDGSANQKIVALLSKHFHVAKSCVTITHGHKSRLKTIEILL